MNLWEIIKNGILDVLHAIFMRSDEVQTAPMNAPETAPIAPQATQVNDSVFPPKITEWAAVIAKWEGANPLSCNPGNLKYSTLTASWGATKGHQASDGGFLCQFKTYTQGFNALCSFLQLGCEDELVAFHSPEARTLEGFTKIYAGNPPQGYITGIEVGLGVPGTTLINTFL